MLTGYYDLKSGVVPSANNQRLSWPVGRERMVGCRLEDVNLYTEMEEMLGMFGKHTVRVRAFEREFCFGKK